jgi:hypothetical protein
VDADLVVRRVQSTSVVVCLVMAAAAVVFGQGRARSAGAVVAGGLLAGISYRMIVSSAETIVRTLTPAAGENGDDRGRPSPALITAKAAGRYALLALLAYVMIARLRLPPLWLLAGASSVVAAVSIEALRLLLKKSP